MELAWTSRCVGARKPSAERCPLRCIGERTEGEQAERQAERERAVSRERELVSSFNHPTSHGPFPFRESSYPCVPPPRFIIFKGEPTNRADTAGTNFFPGKILFFEGAGNSERDECTFSSFFPPLDVRFFPFLFRFFCIYINGNAERVTRPAAHRLICGRRGREREGCTVSRPILFCCIRVLRHEK